MTDEVYEHLDFDGAAHLPLASFPGMRERTVTISSAGKTFSFTGCLSSPANDGEAHPPGTLTLSTRSDGAHIAVPRRPARPLRGVVAVRPVEDEDGWWLLHELRSRSSDITRLAQGQNGREISAGALKRLEVTWPDRFTRTDFHAMADPLHAVARLLLAKIATLHTLRDALLRDISAKAGVLREPTAEPEEQGAPAPRPTAGPAPRGHDRQ